MNWVKAGIMTAVGIGLGSWSGAGAQNFRSMSNLVNAGKSWGSKAFLKYGVSVMDRSATSYARHTAAQLFATAVRGYQIQAVSRTMASFLTGMLVSETFWG